MKQGYLNSDRLLGLFAGIGIGFGFLCGLIVGWACYKAPPLHTSSTSMGYEIPAQAELPIIAANGTGESIDDKEKPADGTDVIPKLGELSQSAFAKLNVSCLGTDLVVDPALAEFAYLNPEQLMSLQNAILEHQRQWSEAEAARCIAIQDQKVPKIIIPPLPESASQAEAEADMKILVESIVGDDRMAVVWGALAKGLRQATGDFGRMPRMITFEKNTHEGEAYRVRVSVFQLDKEEYESMDDWTKLTKRFPSRMASYAFRELPPQFAAFVEEHP